MKKTSNKVFLAIGAKARLSQNTDVGHKMKTIIGLTILIIVAFGDTSPTLGIILDGKAILNKCKSNELARQHAANIVTIRKYQQQTLTNSRYQCGWTPWSTIFSEVISTPSAPPCH